MRLFYPQIGFLSTRYAQNIGDLRLICSGRATNHAAGVYAARMSTYGETPRERIAANVSAELRRRRLTINDMSGLNGRSNSYWQRRTSGDIPFDVDELVIVAGFLGVPVMTLLQGVVESGKSRRSHPSGVTRGYHPSLTSTGHADNFALAA